MKLINSSFEIVNQEPGLTGIYRQIEKAGRNCYKSEDKITETSAKPFVDMLIKKGHGAVLEHGTVYLDIPDDAWVAVCGDYEVNPYSRVTHCCFPESSKHYISTNYRVLVENEWLDDLRYLCKPTDYHQKRVTVKITADIHFYKDATRHRPLSYAIESTRYCDYFKEKFGLSVSFMKPSWLEDKDTEEFEKDCRTVEQIYFKWRDRGWRPEQAAYFLIQGTAATLYITGFISDWQHFFELRCDQAAHPDMRSIASQIRDEFIKRGYIGEH